MRHLLKDSFKGMALASADLLAERAAARRFAFNALRLRQPRMMRLREQDEMRFLASVFNRLPQSKSQILQDLWVLFELDDKQDGFFVEFGATNGLVNSNTWLLETAHGWSGILAEPNPVWHGDLRANRGCSIDTRCVYTSTGSVMTFMATDDPELSGLSAASGRDHNAARRTAGTAFDVQTVSLNDLLDHHGAPRRIDYMSIDTEGSELDILRQFDFGRYDVALFSVEHNHTDNEARIDALLADKGYVRRFPEFSQWDGWYVRREG
ncbi:FkbM family methyltransferase [Phreatobacter sp.]|uniref:FkbM family methyltransferase n=1 Tax=Phreatobacter sp. TaxID=1966341 RepID=UPI003F72C4B3